MWELLGRASQTEGDAAVRGSALGSGEEPAGALVQAPLLLAVQEQEPFCPQQQKKYHLGWRNCFQRRREV